MLLLVIWLVVVWGLLLLRREGSECLALSLAGSIALRSCCLEGGRREGGRLEGEGGGL